MADNDVLLFSEMIDSASLFLTANWDTIYGWSILDLSEGPVAVTVPSDVIVVFSDARFEWLGDGGTPGPDRGEGGRYLIRHIDDETPLPEGGYVVYTSPTKNVTMLCRACLSGDDPRPDADRVRRQLRITPYAPGGFGSSVSRFVIGEGPSASAASKETATSTGMSRRYRPVWPSRSSSSRHWPVPVASA